jgi:hypothetical protein
MTNVYEFLTRDNLGSLSYATNIPVTKLTKIARKWITLGDAIMDPVKEYNLQTLNIMFVAYCNDLTRAPEYTWEESMLNMQLGMWNDKTYKGDLEYHPISKIFQDLRGNPAYHARYKDPYESQKTEIGNNLYKVHSHYKPYTTKQLDDNHNIGEMSAYDMFMKSKRNYM